MSARVEVTSRMVLRALYEVAERQGRAAVSVEDMAAYLKVDEKDVLRELLALRTKRLATDKRRGGQRVWLPWRLA